MWWYSLVGILSNIGQAVLPGGKEAINVGDLGGLEFPKVVVDPDFCNLWICKFHGWIRAIALHWSWRVVEILNVKLSFHISY